MSVNYLRIFSIAIIFILFSFSALAIEKRMSVTDKEILERLYSLDVRIARLEEGQKAIRVEIKEGQRSLQKQIDGLDKRIDGLSNVILGGFGVAFAGIFSLIGFVLWDRRTALSPVISF